MVAGFFWPIALTFAYFGYHHCAGIMLRDWLWPLRHYTKANHVIYGWQDWSDSTRTEIFHAGSLSMRLFKSLLVSPGFVIPVMPLIGVAMFIALAIRVQDEASSAKWNHYLLISGILTGLLISIVIVRPDIIHLMYLAPFWYVLLAWLLGSTDLKNLTLMHIRPYLVMYVSFTFGLMSFALLLTANGAEHEVQTRRGVITTGRKDGVIDYIQRHSVPGQQLLVYPYLPLYNYLTGTQSPSAYDYFQPGMNTHEQAAEMISAIEKQRIGSVLLEPGFASKFANSWPETPLNEIGQDPVADYLVRNYRVCKLLSSGSSWRFEYMVRNQAQCP
jgi:hypothetical protein